ncbi:RNA-BINDING PROTEIN YLMH-RELATED [Salix viminalis]|uniref:RNA-BINDING PROTEIN YLMH-RELATED n=1 Tax=Salix viminalis TaxID=40686 RepID=A0A9Q0Z7S6_SALVM|nr:RNA-BINDING PROTEIN YLMH-RELATED [Salix viminalis]
MAATGTVATPWFLRRGFQALSLSHCLPKTTHISFYGTPLSFPFSNPITSHSGMCHVAQATKGEVVALKGVEDKSVIEEMKRILDMARRASLRREVLHTDFLTPPTLKESLLVLGKLTDIKAIAQGGYPQAERCRLSVGHPQTLTNDPDIVAALSITGNFGLQPCSHGDFLGAILGTGIAKNKLGDIILLGEKGAQVLLVPDLVDYIVSSLDKVGNVSVSCTPIPLLALEYEPPSTKSFKTVEASLRVDALASAGFKISRSKLVDLISNKDVRVNWTTITKNNITLKTGDVVSVRGKGRLKIGEINSTKKGKFAVELIRYQ